LASRYLRRAADILALVSADMFLFAADILALLSGENVRTLLTDALALASGEAQ
jgi:hypothetical protein